MNNPSKCGYIAIVGRPNVGKSTLLNHILGQKLSITSRKPQTTRHQIVGVKTQGDTQFIYVDTPGLHQKEAKAINRVMNRSAASALSDVDVIVFVVDRLQWRDDDEWVLQKIKQAKAPVLLVINKVDQIDDKSTLLPHIEQLNEKYAFEQIIPISALKGLQLEDLETAIAGFLPESIHFFAEDQITDRSERFLVAEIVREKIMRQLGDEIPYSLTVEIEQFKINTAKNGKETANIHALILVERSGQKAIVIGNKGERLKRIGTEARKDIERLLDCKVMLNLWVKVKSGWSDDERALKSLGYDEH